MASRFNLEISASSDTNNNLSALLAQDANKPKESLQNLISYLQGIAAGTIQGNPVTVTAYVPRVLNFNSTNVSTANETITIIGHSLATGDPVVYTATTLGAVGGLTSGTTYFVIRSDANTIKLATTAANALAGTAINLTATGSALTNHSLTSNVAPASLAGTFTGDPTANDTITVADTAFTAKDSGATGNQFNIGLQLAESMANTTAARTNSTEVVLTLTGLPTAADTFTLNGVVFTAIAALPRTGANQFVIGATATATGDNIVSAIALCTDEKVNGICAGVNVTGTVTITAVTNKQITLTAINFKNAFNATKTQKISSIATASRSGDVVTITMRQSGAVSNIVVAESCANFAWAGAVTVMSGGVATPIQYTI